MRRTWQSVRVLLNELGLKLRVASLNPDTQVLGYPGDTELSPHLSATPPINK